jgi:hypothetical protein
MQTVSDRIVNEIYRELMFQTPIDLRIGCTILAGLSLARRLCTKHHCGGRQSIGGSWQYGVLYVDDPLNDVIYGVEKKYGRLGVRRVMESGTRRRCQPESCGG